MMPPGPPGGGSGLGPGGARDAAIVAASRERENLPPRDWGVQEVGRGKQRKKRGGRGVTRLEKGCLF